MHRSLISLFCISSCAWFWNPCRSWCPDTKRTVSHRGTVSKQLCSRSGSEWSLLRVGSHCFHSTTGENDCGVVWNGTSLDILVFLSEPREFVEYPTSATQFVLPVAMMRNRKSAKSSGRRGVSPCNIKDILAMEPFVTEANRQPSKRRKRKSSQSNNAAGNVKVEPGSKKNRSPGPQSFNPMPGVSTSVPGCMVDTLRLSPRCVNGISGQRKCFRVALSIVTDLDEEAKPGSFVSCNWAQTSFSLSLTLSHNGDMDGTIGVREEVNTHKKAQNTLVCRMWWWWGSRPWWEESSETRTSGSSRVSRINSSSQTAARATTRRRERVRAGRAVGAQAAEAPQVDPGQPAPTRPTTSPSRPTSSAIPPDSGVLIKNRPDLLKNQKQNNLHGRVSFLCEHCQFLLLSLELWDYCGVLATVIYWHGCRTSTKPVNSKDKWEQKFDLCAFCGTLNWCKQLQCSCVHHPRKKVVVENGHLV